MNASVLVFAILLAISETLAQYCYRGKGNLTLNFDDESGSQLITAGTPSVGFNLQMSCSRGFIYDKNVVYLHGNGESIFSGTRIGHILADRRAYCQSRAARFEMSCTSDGSGTSLEVNITMFNITHEDNMTVLAVTQKTEVLIKHQLLVSYCSVNDLPSDLKVTLKTMEQYSYGQATHVTCQEKELFLEDDIFSTTMEVVCIEHAQWDIPPHECTPGCKDPRKEDLQVKELGNKRPMTKYKYQTKLELTCRRGRLYNVTNPDHFESNVTSSCQSSGTWSHEELSCWRGRVIDFSVNTVTLPSGHSVIFTCSTATSGNKARMKVGQQVIMGQDHAWLNTTITPQQHGKASCKEIDDFGKEIGRGQTQINVLFPPYVNEEESKNEFGLLRNVDGYVTIEFYANPTVSRNEIRIAKNGTNLSNFYLVMEGVLHRVVVDFLKVEKSVYGSYVLTVIPRRSPRGILKYKFTIYEDRRVATQETKAAELSTATVASLTLGVVLGLVVMSGLVILLIRKLCKSKERVSAKHKNDHHSVQNVDSDIAIISKGRELGSVLYENTRAGGNALPSMKGTEGTYEIPLSRIATAKNSPMVADSAYEYNN